MGRVFALLACMFDAVIFFCVFFLLFLSIFQLFLKHFSFRLEFLRTSKYWLLINFGQKLSENLFFTIWALIQLENRVHDQGRLWLNHAPAQKIVFDDFGRSASWKIVDIKVSLIFGSKVPFQKETFLTILGAKIL